MTSKNTHTPATPPTTQHPPPKLPPLLEALAGAPYVAPGYNAPAEPPTFYDGGWHDPKVATVGPYSRDNGLVDVEEWPWLVLRIEYRGRGRSRYWVGLRRDVGAVPMNGRRFRTYEDAVRHLRRVTAMDRGAALLDRFVGLLGFGEPEDGPADYVLAGGR